MSRFTTAAPRGVLALACAAILIPTLTRGAPLLQARGKDVPGCTRGEVLRTDSELEARSARIREIEFAIGDVFDGSDGDRALYRVANRLHPETREATLRAQLLFGPGELYRRRVLDETARGLRRLRFLYDAQVEPVRYDFELNAVDVRVCTRDVWTLSPGISFGRSGGENSFGFEIEDYNVFGSGQHVSLARKQNVDRASTIVSLDAPNVLGSRWQMTADYHVNTDGGLRALSATRPFFSLDAQRAFGAGLIDSEFRERLYDAGEPVFEFDAAERTLKLWAGRSSGLIDGWTRRYLAGWTFEDHSFRDVPDSAINDPSSGGVPPDRRLSYPWVGLQWIEDGYTETHNVDQIGRTEDMNLGFIGELRAGLASSTLGSDRDAMLLSAAATWSASWRPEQLLQLESRLGTRIEHGGSRNTDAQAAGRGYWRWSERWMSFAGIEGRWTRNLDAERQVLLGGDNGLRGFPLRFQRGNASALLTLEQRLFTGWEPFRLVRVGGAVFFDTGRTWGGPAGPDTARWLKDVGMGLRLGNSRSSRGNVVHIDIAVPLDATDRVEGVQLLVETKTSF